MANTASSECQQAKQLLLQNWQILLLDTHVEDEVGGAVSQSELTWLATALREHPDKHAAIFMHHPLLPVGCAWLDPQRIANAEQVLTLFDNTPQLRVVCNGHVHQEKTIYNACTIACCLRHPLAYNSNAIARITPKMTSRQATAVLCCTPTGILKQKWCAWASWYAMPMRRAVTTSSTDFCSMPFSIVYIHGFNSSPQSHKAQQFQRWIAAQHPEITLHIPALKPFPLDAIKQLEDLANLLQHTGFIGSSLGGFYAVYLAEKFKARAVVINPAVRPFDSLAQYLGENKKLAHKKVMY